MNSWKVWPIITAFSFTFIAPHSRSAFAGCFAVVWQTYLSWLNRAAEEASEMERGGKGRSFERETKEVVKMEARKVEEVVREDVKKVEKVVKKDVKKIEKAVKGEE